MPESEFYSQRGGFAVWTIPMFHPNGRCFERAVTAAGRATMGSIALRGKWTTIGSCAGAYAAEAFLGGWFP